VHVHDSTIDFEKNIFKNAWTLSKFLKIKHFKNFPLYDNQLHKIDDNIITAIIISCTSLGSYGKDEQIIVKH